MFEQIFVTVANDLPVFQLDLRHLQAGPFEFNALLIQGRGVDADLATDMDMVENKRTVTGERHTGMRAPIAVIRAFARLVEDQAVLGILDAVVRLIDPDSLPLVDEHPEFVLPEQDHRSLVGAASC